MDADGDPNKPPTGAGTGAPKNDVGAGAGTVGKKR